MAVTADDVRAHFETDLTDAALGDLINDAEDEIVRLYGAEDSQVDEVEGDSMSAWATRPIQAITQVSESYDRATFADVADAEYVRSGERRLIRKGAYWCPWVKIEYRPVGTERARKRVALDLVKLAAMYQGVRQSSAGSDIRVTLPNYEEERAAILSRLSPSLLVA